MSRFVEIERCAECPRRDAMWCELEHKTITIIEAMRYFPAWCPLPETKEESDAKG